MASDDAKENIADGLVSFKAPIQRPVPSPKKKKTRSKSIGPAGLGALEEKPSALKESNGNRRKVCAALFMVLERDWLIVRSLLLSLQSNRSLCQMI